MATAGKWREARKEETVHCLTAHCIGAQMGKKGTVITVCTEIKCIRNSYWVEWIERGMLCVSFNEFILCNTFKRKQLCYRNA